MCSVEWYGPESASEIKPLQKTSLASASRECETSYKGVEVQLLCAIKCDRQELHIAHSCNVRSLQMLKIPHEALYFSHTYVQAFGATNICNLAAMPWAAKLRAASWLTILINTKPDLRFLRKLYGRYITSYVPSTGHNCKSCSCVNLAGTFLTTRVVTPGGSVFTGFELLSGAGCRFEIFSPRFAAPAMFSLDPITFVNCPAFPSAVCGWMHESPHIHSCATGCAVGSSRKKPGNCP